MLTRILTLISTRNAMESGMLRGILEYRRTHVDWDVSTFIQDASVLKKQLATGQFVGCLGVLGREDLASLVRESGLPAVNLHNGERDFGLPRVGVDSRAIGEMAAQYLCEQGFRSFAFFGLAGADFSRSRCEGFVEALRAGGVEEVDVYDEAKVYTAAGAELPADMQTYKPALWLSMLPAKTAILCSDDIRGRALHDTLRQLGRSIPEDLAVLSVGNDPILCETCATPLSSIDLPAVELGFEAARRLDVLLKGQQLPAGPFLMKPLGVVPRRSTDILHVEHPAIAKAIAYMTAHSVESITAAQVALVAGVSLRSLERAFKDVLGRSPHQELIRIRIEHACARLRNTNDNLDEIGDACGFGSGVYLSQAFKKHTGVSPGAYRKQFRHS